MLVLGHTMGLDLVDHLGRVIRVGFPAPAVPDVELG